MKTNILLILTVTFSFSLAAQTRINDSFSFQSDPNKKYSLFIPENYTAGTPHKTMVAMHPWNTNRWDAESWCDTLLTFATQNDLILICPDGGLDGKIDDPIDLDFTDALIDSMQNWYSLDMDKIYLMGFSWGGLATYTYGLDRAEIFKGYLPIGAAIDGASDLNTTIGNASAKPFYLVHGANDSPNSRYYPLLDALNNNDAITNSLLMAGVGHTIDFDNRNAILTTAFEWIDAQNCALIDNIQSETEISFRYSPNPTSGKLRIEMDSEHGEEIAVYDAQGRLMFEDVFSENIYILDMTLFQDGLYYLHVGNKIEKVLKH